MVNGYVTLDLASNKIYKESLGAIKSGKPVMVVDTPDVYFADKIETATIDDDPVVVIKKNGKTIIIADNNTVSSTGVIYAPTMEEIKDLAGNNRFIEVDGSASNKVTDAYCKCSLSGTHLMIVLAGKVADTTSFTNGSIIASYVIPAWIHNKIVPIFATNNVEIKSGVFYANDYTTQNTNIIFTKASDNTLRLIVGGNLTLTADRSFRIQFDLLIDQE